jgi:hypothetical protein
MVTEKRCPKHVQGYAVYTTQIYIFIYAFVGFVSHNESPVHGHESFKTNSHNSAAT